MGLQVTRLAVDLAATRHVADVLPPLVAATAAAAVLRIIAASVLTVWTLAPAATSCRHRLTVLEESSGNLGVVMVVGGSGSGGVVRGVVLVVTWPQNSYYCML